MTDRLHLNHFDACRTAFPNAPEVCSRVLFVGEDNPLSVAPEHALYPYPQGCAGQRFCDDILGVSHFVYLATWRTNLCVGGWDAKKARPRARELVSRNAPWNIIVALGRKVTDVMSDLTTLGGVQPDWSPFTVRVAVNDGKNNDVPTPLLQIVSLPHPSGRNTIWNDVRRRADARALLREVVPDYPWGEAFGEGVAA